LPDAAISNWAVPEVIGAAGRSTRQVRPFQCTTTGELSRLDAGGWLIVTEIVRRRSE